jgi:hypothetical protein
MNGEREEVNCFTSEGMRKPERYQASTPDREAGSWKLSSDGEIIIPDRISFSISGI